MLSHGIGSTSFVNHDNLPFTITGVLATTGTPVDRTVHVSLQGIEAIHLGWQNGVQVARLSPDRSDPGPHGTGAYTNYCPAFGVGITYGRLWIAARD